LRFSGVSPDGKFVEMVELSPEQHPFFVGCQFHPEYKSKPLQSHPLFTAFVRAAHENRLLTENLTEAQHIEKPEVFEVREKSVAAAGGEE
jgi:CTP synthase